MSTLTTNVIETPTPTPTTERRTTRMNVQRRAAAAARIFDVVATVVLIFGGLLVLSEIVGGVAFLIASAGAETGTSPALILVAMIASAVLTAIVTAINWAGITLATAVAGYVAQRSPEA